MYLCWNRHHWKCQAYSVGIYDWRPDYIAFEVRVWKWGIELELWLDGARGELSAPEAEELASLSRCIQRLDDIVWDKLVKMYDGD